jgi:hypothetical protein
MANTDTITPETLDDLFDLSPQVTTAGPLLPSAGSEDCTSDGCTASCVNC